MVTVGECRAKEKLCSPPLFQTSKTEEQLLILRKAMYILWLCNVRKREKHGIDMSWFLQLSRDIFSIIIKKKFVSFVS